MSMVRMRHASVMIVGCGGRRSRLSDAPLHMAQA